MKMAKSQSMTLEPKSSTKQMGSIHRLGSKEVIPLETIDPEAASTLKAADLPLTKGNYFLLLFGDSEYEPHPEDYEQLPIEFRPAE